jgi:alkanesulfonate monooxygenase SsuD/methylene tetrahydromethanopterin reductase-like flavin-dependent oxidoreductase (luciferase family)
LNTVELSQHIVLQAEIARDHHFDGLFAAQHYLIGPYSAMLQPIPTLAFLAARAPGLWIGTSILLLLSITPSRWPS